MPRNDRSDSLSVRSPDDPRAPLKALQQEAEQELLQAERTRSGGPDHRTPDEEEAERRAARREADGERERTDRDQADAGGPSAPGGDATRGPTRT